VVPDSEKIAELVIENQITADLAEEAMAAERAQHAAAIDSIKASVARERSAWRQERGSMAEEIIRLKRSQPSKWHWLAVSCGGNPADPTRPACVVGPTFVIR
jgi:hypothetical protein